MPITQPAREDVIASPPKAIPNEDRSMCGTLFKEALLYDVVQARIGAVAAILAALLHLAT